MLSSRGNDFSSFYLMALYLEKSLITWGLSSIHGNQVFLKSNRNESEDFNVTLVCPVQVFSLIPLSSVTKLSLNLHSLHLECQKSVVPLFLILQEMGTEWVFNNHFILINKVRDFSAAYFDCKNTGF